MIPFLKISVLFFTLFASPLLTATKYSSKNLKSKDYDSMTSLIRNHITNSKKRFKEEGAEEALEELKIALKILLMKPDRNSPKAPLFLMIQNEMIQYQSFMKSLDEIVTEALRELKSKKGSLGYQASLIYILENTISYIQNITNKESLQILKKISKAKLKIPKKIYSYLLLEMERAPTASPSYLAKRILNQRIKALKKKQKEELKKKTASQKKHNKQRKNMSVSEPVLQILPSKN